MNKQTAVEWLYAHLLPYLESTDPKVMHHFRLCLNEAKVIEKEQLEEMYLKGIENYDPTFKRKEQ